MASDLIIGRNAVREALRAGRTINKIMIAPGSRSGAVKEIINLAKQQKVPVQNVDRRLLDKTARSTNHQGVVAVAAVKSYIELEDLLDNAVRLGLPFLILLDEINDPHNLGAIIRTADAAGVHGIIIPRRRSVQLTSTVAKASAGAVEHVPVARVTNIVQTIKKIKDMGIWVVGADMEGQELFWNVPLDGPVALVIGGEGKGLSRLVKENCDIVVRLPMHGKINSLNASVAAALLTYEVLRQRGKGASDA